MSPLLPARLKGVRIIALPVLPLSDDPETIRTFPPLESDREDPP